MRHDTDPAPIRQEHFCSTDQCRTCPKIPYESCLVREVRLHGELVNSELMLLPGWPLYKVGDEARCVFIVCSGYLKLVATGMAGQQMVVGVAGPCSLLGLNAALLQGVHEVSADALTETILWCVDRRILLELMNSNEDVRRCVMTGIYLESRVLLEDVRRIGLSQTVASRLGALLVDLSRQVGTACGEGHRFPLVLSNGELASMVRTTRESVSRVLAHFGKSGWISMQDRYLTVLDPEALSNAGVPFTNNNPAGETRLVS
jgi:CRP/FNR family cyclic AMP-dependent transcriptional regulator